MTALREPSGVLLGHPKPRIGPPTPARHGLKEFSATAKAMGIDLMPWQETAARYLTARGPGDKHLYSEIAIVVARQQGKTTLMKPLIIGALRAGKRVMHIAQSRELPRVMFGVIANALSEEPDLFPKRRGKVIWPRYGAGQEEITLANNGSYRIAAAGTGGARGWTNDLVIIDELREIDSWAVIEAAQPTLRMSTDGQMIYLSNAGSESSVVLNAVRARAGEDPNLGYLEWSASPERTADDRAGWVEANPAIGHFPGVLRDIEKDYLRAKLSGTMAGFETETLCRWVVTMRELLVDVQAWASLKSDDLGRSRRAYMGIAMDPSGTRASAAKAWKQPDGSIAVQMLREATGSPIDVDLLGDDLRALASAEGILETGIDPLTDAVFSKYLRKVRPVAGREHANASARFVNAVSGGTLHWSDADAVTDDLTWTSRKPHDESGSFQAVRADDDRPITAALAAIRAVWLASGPGGGQARIW